MSDRNVRALRTSARARTQSTGADLQSLERRTLFSGGSVDMVMHWNNVTMDVLRADRTLPGPGWSSRNMAITNIAIFDAVNAIDGSYQSYRLRASGYNEHN